MAVLGDVKHFKVRRPQMCGAVVGADEHVVLLLLLG
jgi:hypothetical protein